MQERIWVAAWNWYPNSFTELDLATRLAALTSAVREMQAVLDHDRGSGRAVGSIGVMQAIFVAPEYFFAAPCRSHASTGRAIERWEFDALDTRLRQLSRQHPRILLMPGTIAWKEPIDMHHIKRQASTYLRISERFMNFSGTEGRRRLVKAVCAHVRISAGGLLHNVALRWPHARELDEREVERWSVADPERWASALDAMVDQLPRGGWTSYGYIADFAYEIFQVRLAGAGHARGLRNTALLLLNGRQVHRYDKRSNFEETRNCGIDTLYMRGEGSNVAHVEGLRLGLEICLDHVNDTLSRLLRDGQRGRLDLHVVLSDWARNRAGPDVLLREGGYKIHASSEASEHGVWRNVGGRLEPVACVRRVTMWGRDLSFWRIALDDGEGLADSFLAGGDDAAP